MEAVREHAPAAQSMRQLAQTIGISAVYLYDLIAWMPDGAELSAAVAENRERRITKDLHPIAKQLRMRRKQAGLTVKELGAQIGWSPGRIRSIEDGATRITVESAQELAKAFGLEFQLVESGSL
jgi:DNA-binding XRE family transcriptional regulator